jgi:hypothetical protein
LKEEPNNQLTSERCVQCAAFNAGNDFDGAPRGYYATAITALRYIYQLIAKKKIMTL